MRVLIIDDNEDAADSIAEVVEGAGHFARVVNSGQAALAALADGPWAVAFLDLKMPQMDGREVALHLQERTPDTRVVVVTGNSVREDLASVSALGIAGLLRKPFQVADLLAYLS